jgi:hypothetical protein
LAIGGDLSGVRSTVEDGEIIVNEKDGNLPDSWDSGHGRAIQGIGKDEREIVSVQSTARISARSRG